MELSRHALAVHERAVEVGAVVHHHVVGGGARHRLPGEEGGRPGEVGVGDLGLVRRGQQDGHRGQRHLGRPPCPRHRPSRASLAEMSTRSPALVSATAVPRYSFMSLSPASATLMPPPASSARAWPSRWGRDLGGAARHVRRTVWKFTSPEEMCQATRRRLVEGSSEVSSIVIRLSGRTWTTVPSKNVISAADPGARAHEVALLQRRCP